MAATLQIFGGMVRLHRTNPAAFGDDFYWSIGLNTDPKKPWIAVLCGLSERPPKPSEILQICLCLRHSNFTKIQYEIKGEWFEHDIAEFLERRR